MFSLLLLFESACHSILSYYKTTPVHAVVVEGCTSALVKTLCHLLCRITFVLPCSSTLGGARFFPPLRLHLFLNKPLCLKYIHKHYATMSVSHRWLCCTVFSACLGLSDLFAVHTGLCSPRRCYLMGPHTTPWPCSSAHCYLQCNYGSLRVGISTCEEIGNNEPIHDSMVGYVVSFGRPQKKGFFVA